MCGLKVPYLKNDCEKGLFAVWIDFPGDLPVKFTLKKCPGQILDRMWPSSLEKKPQLHIYLHFSFHTFCFYWLLIKKQNYNLIGCRSWLYK